MYFFLVSEYKNSPIARPEQLRIKRIHEILETERTFYHTLNLVQLVGYSRYFFVTIVNGHFNFHCRNILFLWKSLLVYLHLIYLNYLIIGILF